MNIRESSYGYWSSSRAFVWVATGACIGIGNVVRLPYLMSEHGGSVFLLAYAGALLLLGMPMLGAEWVLGRWMRDDLSSGFSRMTDTAGVSRHWRALGGLLLLTAVLVLSYYSVIAGWSMGYAFRAAGGVLNGADAEQLRQSFSAMVSDPERGLAWHTLFMVMVCIIVSHGVREGIEHAAARLVPAAFLLAAALCLYAALFGSMDQAVFSLLQPNWAAFGWRGLMEAIHQAFFTLSLGLGVMLTLGSYLHAQTPLLRVGLMVVMLDLVFSLLVGLAAFSLIYQANIETAPGLALIFYVLPQAMPAGYPGILLAVSFFVLMLLVTMTSAIALLEPVTRYLMDRQRTTRVFATTTGAILIWALGIFSLLSFSVLQDVQIWGRNFFEWAQWLTARLFAPLGGLLLCIFTARIIPRDFARTAFGEREAWAFGLWAWTLRFPARLGLICLLLYALGLVQWLAELWTPGARG
jgi:neurotransmitter:Na+ symporter, NSS family